MTNPSLSYRQKYQKYKSLYLTLPSKVYPPHIAGKEPKKSSHLSYFFDNDTDNFSDAHLCPQVIPVRVAESLPRPRGDTLESDNDNETYTTPQVYQSYCRCLTPGAQLFGQTMDRLEPSGYDPKSGISPEQLSYYTDLVSDRSTKTHTIIDHFIFDWDRTLTVLEGIYAVKPTARDVLANVGLKQLPTSEMAIYYLGGPDRVVKLKRLWKCLKARNIKIWILSSNPSVGQYPQFFVDLLGSVGLDLPRERVCYRGGLSKYQYLKKNIV